MIEQSRIPRPGRFHARGLPLLAVAALAALVATVGAQSPIATTAPDAAGAPAVLPAAVLQPPTAGDNLQQTSCASCGAATTCAPAPPSLGGCPSGCHAGRYPCDCCYCPTTKLGAFFYGTYKAVVCPDPCHEPTWRPLANAAFFVDQVKPMTQGRIGFDLGWDVLLPDKAELFWRRIANGGPPRVEQSMDYQDAYLYTETAVENFGFFVYLPYRHVDPLVNDSASGLGNMSLGTKTSLLDSELLQLTFQFRTELPTGTAVTRGIGNGHTSLEPSVISAIKVSDSCYLQGQLGYFFPIGGTAGFQGSLVTSGLAANTVLCQCGNDIQLIGTLETNVYWFTNGSYTDPVLGTPVRARNLSPMWSLGCGLRLLMGRSVDFGVGFRGAPAEDRMEQTRVVSEIRWRF